MKRLLACGVGVILLALGTTCSEPDRRVMAASSDGAIEVTLSAKKNWLRPGESLPIRVQVRSVVGQLAQTTRESLTFVSNNGTVVPSLLSVTFVGLQDSISAGVTEVYEGWVTFSVSSFTSSDRQGELHALFGDAQATLKIRIVDGD